MDPRRLVPRLGGLCLALALAAAAAAAETRVCHFEIRAEPLSVALRIFAEACGENVVFTEGAVAGAPKASLVGDYTAGEALQRLLAGTRLSATRSPSGALMIAGPPGPSAAVGAPPRETAAASAAAGPPAAAAATGDEGGASHVAPREAAAAPLAEVVVTGTRIASRGYASDSPLVTIARALFSASGQVSLDAAIGRLPQFAAAQGQTEVGDVQGATGFQGGQSFADLRGLGANRTLVLLDGRRLVPTTPTGAVDLNVIPSALIEDIDVITGGASAVYGSDAMAGVINFRLRDDFHGAQVDLQRGATTHGDGEETKLDVLLGTNFRDRRGNAVLDVEYAEREPVTGADRASFFARIPRKVPRPPEGFFNGIDIGGLPTVAAVNAVLAQYPGTVPLGGAGAYTGAIGVNADGTIFTANDAPNCVQNYRGPLAPRTLGLQPSPDCARLNAYLGPYFAIQVPMRRYNLFTRATYRLAEDLQAYAQVGYMHSTAQDLQGAAFVGPGKYFDIPLYNPYVTGNAALQAILASRTNPTDPAELAGPLRLSAWLTEFGPRIETFAYDDYQAVAGLKGAVEDARLRWEAYASYGRTQFDNAEANNVDLPAVETILYGNASFRGADGSTCIGFAWNPLGGHPLGKGCLEYTTHTAHNTNVLTQKVVEATLSGDLAQLPQGMLRFAFGVDYRGESFDYSPDASLSPAFNVMPAPYPPNVASPSYDLVGPTSGAQNVREVYAELQMPLVTNRPYAKDVAVDLGARRSSYDLFGGVNTWKADFHWQTNGAFMLRGGYERAIRAPSLGELYDTTRQAQDNVSVDPCEVGSSYRVGPDAAQVQALCLATGVPAALYPTFAYGLQSIPGVSSGNPSLQPETADTYSLGFVFTPRLRPAPLRDLSASVDYWHIRIDGAIALLRLDQMLGRCFNASGANPTYAPNDFYCRKFTRDPANGDITLGTEVWKNLAAYDTDGADVELNWALPFAALGLPARAGRITLNSYVSYLHSLRVAELAGAPGFDYAGTLVATSASPDLAHPRWKANTTLGYAVGELSSALHWRFIGAMADWVPSEGPTSAGPGVRAYHYFDLDARWQVRESLELRAGVTNVLDKGPPVVVGAPLYTDAATYDPMGRAWFVGLVAKLR